MSENTVLVIVAIIGLMNTGALGLLVSMNFKLGRLNGTVARHDKQLKMCPLCPDKGGTDHAQH